MGIKEIAEFFKPHLVSKTLQPSIKVEFHTYDPTLEADYRQKWEGLLAVLDPSTIIRREWKDYYQGHKFEELLIELEGVKMYLEGAYYPAPLSPKEQQPVLSVQEQADRQVDAILTQYNFNWAITNASKLKVANVLAYLKAIAGERQVDQDLVDKAADRVIALLRLAKDARLP